MRLAQAASLPYNPSIDTTTATSAATAVGSSDSSGGIASYGIPTENTFNRVAFLAMALVHPHPLNTLY